MPNVMLSFYLQQLHMLYSSLLYSALKPHGDNIFKNPTLYTKWVLASIDHSMWFHRPFRVDEWLYYRCDPVSTGSSRGLARGQFLDANGNLVASTMQEGLMRKIKEG